MVAWFGTDLRAGSCEVKPGVEVLGKSTHPLAWSVAGLTRATAHLVSTIDGRPAFGGTPSDASVTHLIAELKARGLKVTLYPFMMMDIPADNSLADPQTGAAPQPAYPWRGHITCDPAPGQPGSPDGTRGAATQIDAFFGIGDADRLELPPPGSALRQPRGGCGRRRCLPDRLGTARPDARALGVRRLSGGDAARRARRRREGDRRRRHDRHLWRRLDRIRRACRRRRRAGGALSARCAVGVVGDRRGRHRLLRAARRLARRRGRTRPRAHGLDLRSAPISPATCAAARPTTGTTPTTRRAPRRRAAPITDGLGKPWVFRAKDLWNWWANPHYERVGGAELGSPTAWTPQGKPIWLTEIGCPAVDKGANQPSTFPDAKSADGGLPYFSNGRRDDLIQRRFLEAVLGAFDPAFGATDESNPVSSVYGGRMIAPTRSICGPGTRGPIRSFPPRSTSGATARTGRPATG